MATDLERLVVSLEANIKKYESSLKKAMVQTDGTAKGIERRFLDMNKNVAKSFDFGSSLGGIGRLAGGVISTAAAVQFLDSAKKIDNALKVAGLSGEELNNVYGKLYESAQRNGAPLESLAELYGKVALSQKELGIGSLELAKFTDNVAIALRVSGKTAAESSGALLQFSQALGAGVVRAEEFNSILEGAPAIAQAAAAGIQEAGGSVAKLRQLVNEGEVSSKVFFLGFQAGADGLRTKAAAMDQTISQAFTNLKNSAINAAREIDQTSRISAAAVNGVNNLALAVERLVAAYKALAAFTGETGTGVAALGNAADDLWKNPSWRNLVRFLEPGAEKLLFGSVEDKSIQARIDGVQKLAQEMKSVEALRQEGLNKMKGKTGNSRFDDAFAPFQPKPISLKDYPADKKKEGGEADIFQRAIAQAERRTAVLGAETAAIDLGAAAQARARVETELMTAAVRANEAAKLKDTSATKEQKAEIDRVADAYMRVREEVEKANGPLAQFARQSRDTNMMLQEAGVSGLRSFEDGLIDIVTHADNAKDAFKRMAASILSDLARIAIRQSITGPLAAALGGAFGGGSSPISMFGGAGPNFAVPTYARGTKNHPGGLAWVGEEGPELVNLPRRSVVIPNAQSMQMAGSRSGGAFTFAPQIDARGADVAAVARLEQVVARQAMEFESRVKTIVRDRPNGRW